MHDVFSRGKDDSQGNDIEDVSKRGEPGEVEHPQAELKQNARDGEDHCQPKARLGEEESVPIGLHGEQGQRQVGDPEDDTRATQGGAPGVEKVAFQDQA